MRCKEKIMNDFAKNDNCKNAGKIKKSAAFFLAFMITCSLFPFPSVHAQTKEDQTVVESSVDSTSDEFEEDKLNILEDSDEEIIEDDDTLLKEVSVKNVSIPIGGNNIDLTADTGSDKYKISHIYYVCVDGRGNVSYPYKSSEIYNAGCTYSVKIYLQPASGYHFSTTSAGLCNISGTIDGKKASMRRVRKENNEIYDASKMICLSYTFAKAGQQNITAKQASCAAIATVTYTGSALKPKVNFSGLTKDKDFKLAYSNNVSVGTASVKITGIGNYTGSFVRTFRINPKQVSIRKITAKKSRLRVHSAIRLSATGGSYFEIQFHKTTKKAWKSVKSTHTLTVLKKLKKKKRYVVRMRACRKIGNVTYYGAWSPVVTTKKVK